MSETVWGAIILDRAGHTLAEKVELGFKLIAIGALNHVGIDLEGRVPCIPQSEYDKRERTPSSLFFALTGHSLTPNPDALIIEDGVAIYNADFGDEDVPDSRLSRAQGLMRQARESLNIDHHPEESRQSRTSEFQRLVYEAAALGIDPENREDIGESLDARMSKLQRFMEEATSLDMVKRIVRRGNITGDYTPETIELKAADFKSTMLGLYQKNGGYAPHIRLVITK